MKILAIDTTENTAAVAVCEDQNLLGSIQLTKTRTHSESMLPMIDALLSQLHLTLDDIDLYAVSAGPGSFTGVRIGAATVKGLTFGKDKKILPVSALEAMAWNHADADCLVCPVMDARRGQVYAALLSTEGGEVRYLQGMEDQVIMAQELVDLIANRYPGSRVRFTGGAYDVLVRLATDRDAFVIDRSPEPLRYEHAYGVALCAWMKYRKDSGAVVSDIALAPTYLRASQAERERLEREEKENQ